METENPKQRLIAQAVAGKEAASKISILPPVAKIQNKLGAIIQAASKDPTASYVATNYGITRMNPGDLPKLQKVQNTLARGAQAGRMANALGMTAYANKLGDATTRKDAIDAILGMMIGGLPAATLGSLMATPSARRMNDYADVIDNGSKEVWL